MVHLFINRVHLFNIDPGDAGSDVNVNGKDGGYGAGGGAATPRRNEQTKAGNGGNGIVIFRWGAGSD